jgi:hypothetical protein
MNDAELERRILEIWMTTRIPLTLPNLGFLTGVPRKKLEARLRDLCVHGVLEADSDDAGDMFYTVPGAVRPRSGPETPGELAKLRDLKKQVSGLGAAAQALAVRPSVTALVPAGEKSVIASGILSFFFGPLGWLYAGSWKEAVPASVAYALAYTILPLFFFAPLAAILHPVAAAVGVGYAWKHNRAGSRQPILPDEEKP